jgi:hypothetical protein
VSPADLRLHRLDHRADELDDATAFAADQMIVSLPHVHVLVQVPVSTESVLAHEPAFHEKIEVAIHGRPRGLQTVRLHGPQELLGIDMAMLSKDLVEKSQTLTCEPQPALAHELDEVLSLWDKAHDSNSFTAESLVVEHESAAPTPVCAASAPRRDSKTSGGRAMRTSIFATRPRARKRGPR